MAVLIVEDNPISAKMMNAFLDKKGFNTILASNGKEAFAKLQAKHRKIELILLDIMMPEIDGFQFLRLKQDNVQWKMIPVIICSAFNNIEVVSKAIKMGCVDYVLKPIDFNQLFEKMQQALGKCYGPGNLQENSHQEDDIFIFRDIVLTFSDMARNKIIQMFDMLKADRHTKEIDFSDMSEASSSYNAKWMSNVLLQMSDIYHHIKWSEMTSELIQKLKMQMNILEKVLPAKDFNQIPQSHLMKDFWYSVRTKNSDMINEIVAFEKNYNTDSMMYIKIVFIDENMITYDPIVNVNGEILCQSGIYLKMEHIVKLLKIAQNEIIIEPFRVINNNLFDRHKAVNEKLLDNISSEK